MGHGPLNLRRANHLERGFWAARRVGFAAFLLQGGSRGPSRPFPLHPKSPPKLLRSAPENPRPFGWSLTKPNTFRHNQPASVASLRRLFAFPGKPFGFPLESAFTFTGIPTKSVDSGTGLYSPTGHAKRLVFSNAGGGWKRGFCHIRDSLLQISAKPISGCS